MTPAEVEAMLSKIVKFRADLIDQWVQVMRFDDAPISPELAECRAAIVRDAEWAEATEMRVRRALAEVRAGVALDAGLVDLIARYRHPWN